MAGAVSPSKTVAQTAFTLTALGLLRTRNAADIGGQTLDCRAGRVFRVGPQVFVHLPFAGHARQLADRGRGLRRGRRLGDWRREGIVVEGDPDYDGNCGEGSGEGDGVGGGSLARSIGTGSEDRRLILERLRHPAAQFAVQRPLAAQGVADQVKRVPTVRQFPVLLDARDLLVRLARIQLTVHQFRNSFHITISCPPACPVMAAILLLSPRVPGRSVSGRCRSGSSLYWLYLRS